MSDRKITLKTPNSKRPLDVNEAVISFSTHLKEKTEPHWVDPDTLEDIEIAMHRDCSNHYDKIIEYNCASCFHCLKTFVPKNIQEWADEVRWTDEGQTAICPNCGIDAILPGVVSNDILVLMHHHWFCTATNLSTGEELSVCDCD